MKVKRIVSLVLCLALILSVALFPSNAAEKSEITTTSSMKSYDLYLEKMMKTAKIEGVAYVTKDGSVIGQHASGMQNTQANKAMSIDALFPIGSVSKQFCATAVLLLNEQGKLNLDDTLSMYFPTYEIGKDITIHELLSMRSGIRDHVNYDEDYKGFEDPLAQYTLSDKASYKENQKIITDWLFTQELKFTPNEKFDYSNANFLLLSMIVEKVSGEKYSDFVQKNIFDKLSMTNSGFYEDLVESENLAEHHLPEGQFPIDAYCKGLSQGAGDIVSNAKDMDKWLTSISKRTLLTDKSYDLMTEDYGENYGYGVMTDKNLGSIYHNGNITTYETCILTVPEKEINVFVVTSDVESVYKKNYNMNLFANAIAKKFTGKTVVGDVNEDKDITIIDATTIQRHVAQLTTFTSAQLKAGDANGDGDVTIIDATEIQRFIAKI
ncbi:MAG: serine hydrolase [Ruminococcus sp.]|nr:serine hydrolase [Ruminococcus sp.]